MKPALLLLASAATSAVVGGALVLTLSQNSGGAGTESSAEVTTLRSQLDEMHKELTALRARVETQTAAADQSAPRMVAEAPKVKPEATAADDGEPAIQVPTVERDMILAVIEQREKDKDKERKDKQRQQARETIEAGVKRAADRVGLDANAASSIAKLYIENLGREDEIRRAYPINGQNDPNVEKARLEIDAARSSLDTAVATMVPAEKSQDFNNQTRWLRRLGDTLYNADQMASGTFNMFGGMGGRGGFDVGFGGGGPGGGGATAGQRDGNRQRGPMTVTGAGAATVPAPLPPAQSVVPTKQP
jgi:hypothetical protein